MLVPVNRSEQLREASGEISYSDPLTLFFYLLMRDGMPAGKVEELVSKTIEGADECSFVNGWLAKYANNLAEEVRNAESIKLQNSLEQAFKDEAGKDTDEDEEENEIRKAAHELVMKSVKSRVAKKKEKKTKNIDDDSFTDLESKLIQIANSTVSDKDKDIEEDIVFITRDSALKAKEALQHMVDGGLMSQEDADRMSNEVDETVEKAKEEAESSGSGLTVPDGVDPVDLTVPDNVDPVDLTTPTGLEGLGDDDSPQYFVNEKEGLVLDREGLSDLPDDDQKQYTLVNRLPDEEE